VVTTILLLAAQLLVGSPAAAAVAPVGLGTAGTYSVLGGATVTNTGPTTLSGDLGVSPGTAITGFPPGTVGGATHAGDAQAAQAQSDLTIGYNDAAGRAATANVSGDLVGQTLSTGVYKSTSSLAVSGTLMLDGQGDPNAVFIFQIGSTLTTASSSNITVINAARACNVFWQVGSSATLGTTSSFLGTIMALTSITVTTNATVKGRALARNGAVTLDNDTFTTPGCGPAPSPTPTPTPTPPPSTTPAAIATTTTLTASPSPATAGGSVKLTAAVSAAGAVPSGTVTFSEGGASLGTASLDATGHATLTIPAGSAPSTRTITAHYNGNLTFSPSTSSAIALRVLAAPTTSSPSTAINAPSSSLFVPGAGLTGDSRPGGSPLTVLLVVALLGSVLVIAVGPLRRRGKYS
jgi:hypothetical protein